LRREIGEIIMTYANDAEVAIAEENPTALSNQDEQEDRPRYSIEPIENEAEIIQQYARKGENSDQAFRILWEAYQRPILKTICKNHAGNNLALAEEMVQEGWLLWSEYVTGKQEQLDYGGIAMILYNMHFAAKRWKQSEYKTQVIPIKVKQNSTKQTTKKVILREGTIVIVPPENVVSVQMKKRVLRKPPKSLDSITNFNNLFSINPSQQPDQIVTHQEISNAIKKTAIELFLKEREKIVDAIKTGLNDIQTGSLTGPQIEKRKQSIRSKLQQLNNSYFQQDIYELIQMGKKTQYIAQELCMNPSDKVSLEETTARVYAQTRRMVVYFQTHLKKYID